MGEKDVTRGSDTEQLRVFTKRVLDDLRALGQVIDGGLVESGIRRIGAEQDLVTVSPETPTVEAIKLMRENKIGCLPVTTDSKLVGLVTEREFTGIAGQLLEKMLQE